jgi:hypothetical protein
MDCAFCGETNIPVGTPVCKGCGAQLNVAPPLIQATTGVNCGNCGKPVKAGRQKCQACGQPLGGTPSTAGTGIPGTNTIPRPPVTPNFPATPTRQQTSQQKLSLQRQQPTGQQATTSAQQITVIDAENYSNNGSHDPGVVMANWILVEETDGYKFKIKWELQGIDWAQISFGTKAAIRLHMHGNLIEEVSEGRTKVRITMFKGQGQQTSHAASWERIIDIPSKVRPDPAQNNNSVVQLQLLPPVITVKAGNGKNEIRWNTVRGAEKYKVLRKNPGGTFGVLYEVTELFYTDTNLPNGRQFIYAVISVGPNGNESVVSDEEAGTTIAPAPTQETAIATQVPDYCHSCQEDLREHHPYLNTGRAVYCPNCAALLRN